MRVTKFFANFVLALSQRAVLLVRIDVRVPVGLNMKRRVSKWLDEQLGKVPAAISKWCTNSCQPTLETLIKISKLLDVELADLVRVE